MNKTQLETNLALHMRAMMKDIQEYFTEHPELPVNENSEYIGQTGIALFPFQGVDGIAWADSIIPDPDDSLDYRHAYYFNVHVGQYKFEVDDEEGEADEC